MDNRLIVKISGEQLGSDEYNFDILQASQIADVLEALIKSNYKIACVMGGGNIVRGNKLHKNGFSNQIIADQMGMMATVQNGLFLNEVINQRKIVESRLFSNIPVESLCERFSYQRAMKYMAESKVVLIAGGLGKPGFTTDTAVVAQAFELHCEAVVKTTKVNGIYTKDPELDSSATRYERLSYEQALQNPDIKVMDKAAIALAADKKIKVIVCESNSDSVLAVLGGDTTKGTIVG
ncbi:uridylate kinase [Candidatus Saccharibacteria bacterium]|nr:uridylate kinase [Candidatus Saccharibacteria bacterium]